MADVSAGDQLAPARGAQRLILIAIVAAIAYPLFVHYVGLRPVSVLEFSYPKISGYPQRKTPDMAGAHGLDFSQIYLSARNLSAGEEVYYPVDMATWRREWSSTYHPFTHWLYVPVSKLRFGQALVFHNIAIVAVLLLCSFLAMRSAGCARAFPGVAATMLALIFLTPTGLLHMERGQLDLYSAAAYVCAFALFAGGGAGWAVAGGVLGTLKVTAWSYLVYYWIISITILGARDRGPWLLPGTLLLLTLLFVLQVVDWLPAFRYVAENTALRGPSFTRVLPNVLAFALPALSAAGVVGAALVALRRSDQLSDAAARQALMDRVSFPLVVALTLQALGATPVTHDYRLAVLVAWVPAFAIWCQRTPTLPRGVRWAVGLGYAAITIVAMRVRPFFSLPYDEMTWLLVLASAVAVGAAVTLALQSTGDEEVSAVAP